MNWHRNLKFLYYCLYYRKTDEIPYYPLNFTEILKNQYMV